MNRTNEYRAKGFELLSLAETVNDPERRADMLRYARMWMNLSEPLPDVPSAYELPRPAPTRRAPRRMAKRRIDKAARRDNGRPFRVRSVMPADGRGTAFCS